MLTELQKRAAQGIVNVFETGRARGRYGQVTVLAGDTGHLTYGRAQTTLASGNLYLLIKAYVEAPGATLADKLAPFLDRLAEHDTRLDDHLTFHDLLRGAGDDPVMHRVQDGFFDRVYWDPSVSAAEGIGLTTPLGTGTVYDSRVHGSWGLMRDRTNERYGTPAAIGEQTWIGKYVATRREWLATHSNELLHRTVYRMDSLRELIDAARWSLALPFTLRGVVIDEAVLTDEGIGPERVSALGGEGRMLRLAAPRLQGDDVRAVQQALVARHLSTEVSGAYGSETARAVAAFQRQAGLVPDGIVGPATRRALGLD